VSKIKKVILILFFFLGVFQPLYSLTKILIFGKLFDYSVYLRIAEATLKNKDAYLFGDVNYPPPAFFIFIPFYFLPIFWGQLAWSILSFLCLFFALFFSLKSLNINYQWKYFVFILPLTLLAFPTKWTLGLGQINNLILLLLVLGFFFCQKEKFFLSGVVLGIATSLKILPVACLFYFLIKRKFKIFLSGLGTMAFCFILSGFVFGFNLILEYFAKIVPASFEISRKYIYYNQAVSGFFSRLLNNPILAAKLTFVFSFVILFVTAIILFLKETKTSSLGYSLTISTLLLVSPFSWQHHFVWLVFPFLTVFAYLKRSFDRKLLLLTFFAYLLVAINLKRPELLMGNFFGKIFVSHVFLGNFLLWLLLIFIMQRDEKIFY